MVHHALCPLLLACLAGLSASEREQGGAEVATTAYGPSSVAIRGVSTVTVGVPYGFLCSASCSPACTFTWIRGNQTSRGPELSLQLKEQLLPQVLTCVAVNPTTGKSASVNKTLQVTEGPSNIKISGPPMLTVDTENRFTCSADCYPSCAYTWTLQWEGETLRTTEGSSISVLPPSTAYAETLVCQAQDTVSHLFISTSLQVWVARLSGIYITGPSSVTVGEKYNFNCYVECTPSCNYTWIFNGKTYHSDQIFLPVFHKGKKPVVVSKIDIPVSDYVKSMPLICEAQNTDSGAVIRATKILTVTDPIAVRPVNQAKPVAGQPFSLQCVGSQNPASIIWQRNGLPIPASSGVHLSPNNSTLSFSPLLQSDGGLYQCVVSEGGGSIKSMGLQINVNYGPLQAVITESSKGPVGKEMYVSPGSKAALECTADCYPGCSYSWFYNGRLLSTNASISFSPVVPPFQGALTCVAQNSVSKRNSSAQTTVVVPEGPLNVVISGPDSLQVGVKASFKCTATCTPSCRYTWSVYGGTMTGSVINITIINNVDTDSISCEAQNTITGKTATVNETLSVSNPIAVRPVNQAKPVAGQPFSLQCVGSQNPASIIWQRNGLPIPASSGVHLSPNNSTLSFSPLLQSDGGLYQCVVSEGGGSIKSMGLQINVNYGPLQAVITESSKGPVGKEMYVSPGSNAALECTADCYPGCSYSWFYNGRLLSTNASISFSPVVPPFQGALTCVAQNSVSKRNSSAQTTVVVPEGPLNVVISGPDSLQVGVKASFKCTATCTPSCRYTWSVYGGTMTGSVINITIINNVDTDSISCEAQNTITGKTATVNETLSVSNPIAVRPVNQAKPVAGQPFSLQCVGSQNPASIIWQRNGLPIPASSGVHLSPNNSTLSFSPLLQSDGGLYQCVVSEGGGSIKSMGLQINVNYGPLQAVITESSKGPVGKEMYVSPGSNAALECTADCYPGCSYSWFYNGRLLSTNASISFSPVVPPFQGALTCVAQNSVSKRNSSAQTTVVVPEGPLNVVISGPDSLQVGVKASFKCTATCTPSCRYTWSVYGGTMTGSVINITIINNVDTDSISCEAQNTITGKTATVNETLSVSNPIAVRPVNQAKPVAGQPFSLQCVGSQNPASIIWQRNGLPIPASSGVHLSPNNSTLSFSPLLQSDGGLYQCVVSEGGGSIKSMGLQINVNYGPLQAVITESSKGPVGKEMYVSPGSKAALECTADCYPGCSYSWFYNGRLLSTNASISFSPVVPPFQGALTCVAQNSVSKRNSSAQTTVVVPEGPLNVVISGPDSLQVGVKASFKCTATCTPSCRYTWSVYGGTMTGSVINITIINNVDTDSISCEAQNTITGKTATVNETLSVSNPIAVRPVNQAKPVAGQPFSLQCVGSQNPASIIWQRNGLPIPASSGVHLSPNNSTLSFSPLLQSDGGLYQCVVSEGGGSIKSMGLQINVNYGPLQAVITESSKGPVGKEMYVSPGSKAALECTADCYPGCSYSWFYNGRLLSTNASISFSPVVPPFQGALTCVAQNSVSKRNSSAQTTVVVPEGPLNVVISGPDSLQVGVKASFKCTATCTPSCRYTWSVYGGTMTGSVMDITINRYVDTDSISCEAQNTITGKTATVNETLSVSEPRWCGC